MRVYGILLVGFSFGFALQNACGADQSRLPSALDAAPFGVAEVQEGGKAYGVRWAKPRKIRRVVVEFPPDAGLPDPQNVRVQYWHRWWDGKPDPFLSHAAGSAGWTRMDDWTNGGWKDADSGVQVDGRRWTFTFARTGEKEFAKLGRGGVGYRKTLAIRLLADGPLPKPAAFRSSSTTRGWAKMRTRLT